MAAQPPATIYKLICSNCGKEVEIRILENNGPGWFHLDDGSKICRDSSINEIIGKPD